MILTPGCEFFSAKCAQFPLIFTEWNPVKDIFLLELLSFNFEINLISKWTSKVIQIVHCFVNKEKYCQICACFVSFSFTLLVYVHHGNEMERCHCKSHWNILVFCTIKKWCQIWICPWKNVWFCFISIACVHFSYKIDKFWFWKPLKYVNVFW